MLYEVLMIIILVSHTSLNLIWLILFIWLLEMWDDTGIIIGVYNSQDILDDMICSVLKGVHTAWQSKLLSSAVLLIFQ